MELVEAKRVIESKGYEIDNIFYIDKGGSHHNFDITLTDNTNIIARFKIPEINEDMHFKGPISISREAALCKLIKKNGLPAPEVIDVYADENFMLVKKLPGIYWSTFLENNNYSLNSYLRSLKFLGADLAKAHEIKFETYGDIISESLVEPKGVTNFATRMHDVAKLKLREARKVLNEEEFTEVKNYFSRLEEVFINTLPCLIITDLHAANFFVDDTGKPSGYQDIESAQAGIQSLELLFLRVNIFNYFDKSTYEKAEDTFLESYRANGGEYNDQDLTTKSIEKVMLVSHLLGAVVGYFGVKDGIRDKWSERFKDILFRVIRTEELAYTNIADVLRTKTKQPKTPLEDIISK